MRNSKMGGRNGKLDGIQEISSIGDHAVYSGQTLSCLQETHFRFKDANRSKVKGWEIHILKIESQKIGSDSAVIRQSRL